MSSNLNNKKYPINLKINITDLSAPNSKKIFLANKKSRTIINKSHNNSSMKNTKKKLEHADTDTEIIVSSFIESLFDDYHLTEGNNYSKEDTKKKIQEKNYNRTIGKNLTKDFKQRNNKNVYKLNSLRRIKIKNNSFKKGNKMNKTTEIKINLDPDETNICGDIFIKIEMDKINIQKRLCEEKLSGINKQISLLQKQKDEINKQLSLLKIKENELKEKNKEKEETKDNKKNQKTSNRKEKEEKDQKEEKETEKLYFDKGDEAEDLIKIFNTNAEKREEHLYPFAEKNNEISEYKVYEDVIRKTSPKKDKINNITLNNKGNNKNRTIINPKCTANMYKKTMKTITSNEAYKKPKKFK